MVCLWGIKYDFSALSNTALSTRKMEKAVSSHVADKKLDVIL